MALVSSILQRTSLWWIRNIEMKHKKKNSISFSDRSLTALLSKPSTPGALLKWKFRI